MPRFTLPRSATRWVTCLVLAAVLAAPATIVAQPAPIKIAVVNLEAIAARTSAGKELSANLDAFQKQVTSESDTKRKAALAIGKQINDGLNSLSEAKLSELQKQYQDAQIDLKRYQDDKQREGQKMQDEGLRKIEGEMKPVFEAIRDEEGYDLVLNYVPGVVVLAGERVDITQKVIDRLPPSSGN